MPSSAANTAAVADGTAAASAGQATAAAVLDVADLRLSIGDAAVVDGVSLRVAAGQVRALVGESGSGKSLTALAILGLTPPLARVSGSIEVVGQQIVGASAARLREIRRTSIGSVFQSPQGSWDPVHRVGSQMVEAIRVAAPELGRREARQRAYAALERVRLLNPMAIAAKYPHELSGGQAQRVALALALARRPRLLIADEPTTALDVRVQAQIVELIAELAQTEHLATLLITHDLGVVASIADEVTVLRGGQVVEAGTTRSVITTPQRSYTRELLAAVPRLAAPPRDGGSGSPHSTNLTTLTDRPDAAGETAVRADHLTVRYGQFIALDDITVAFPAGEITAIVGESGAGKSTLAKTLVGLVGATAGRVSLDGRPVSIRRASRRWVGERVGMIFQDPTSSFNPQRRIRTSVPGDRAAIAAALAEVSLPRPTLPTATRCN